MSPRASARPRRSWPQRLVIAFNVVAIVAALTSAGALAYAKRTVSDLKRTSDIGRDVITPADELPPGEPENFLIVGTDSDEGLAANDPVRNDRKRVTQGTTRSDSIMLVRIDPRHTQVKVMSFPRDLLVKIPGRTGTQKINAAFAYGKGSAGLLVQTIKDNFDITVNHYVQVDLAGFEDLVNEVGGVPIWFPTPVRDLHSGLLVENPGCTTLDKNGALSYARSRYFQYKDARGKWRSDGASDYGRVTRQQDFMRRVIARAISQGARNPVKLASMVNAGVKHIRLDPFTTPQDLIALGRAFRSFDPNKLETHALAVTEARKGGADVLYLVPSASEPILDMFRGTGASGASATDITPDSVTVQVVNGTGRHNQASTLTSRFSAVGFKVSDPQSGSLVDRTEIRYPAGDDAAALLVARYIDGNPLLIPDDNVDTLTVVSGPDLVDVLSAPKAASAVSTTTSTSTSTTTTTTAPTTTTTARPGKGTTTSTTPIPLQPGTGPDGQPAGYLPGPPPPGVSCG